MKFLILSIFLVNLNLAFSQQSRTFWAIGNGYGDYCYEACLRASKKATKELIKKCDELDYKKYEIIDRSNCECQVYDDDCDVSDGGGHTCDNIPISYDSKVTIKAKCISGSIQ